MSLASTKSYSPVTEPSLLRRLRVAHVTLGLDVGGQERLLVEFARHADRALFDLCFVSLTGRGWLADQIEEHGWPVLTMHEQAGFRPGIGVRLARLLRRERIDVIHTHDERPLVYGALASCLVRGVHHVHTRHGQRVEITRGQKLLVWLASCGTGEFVCVSEDAGRVAVAQGIAARKIRTVWNGIDLTKFSYIGPRPGGPAILVARLSPIKDVETLLRAAALAVAEQPGFRVEIAGDGPCLADLRRVTSELCLAETVRFLGEVRDVPALLARAGLVVLSSLSEGVSLTLLEGMARGLPVVATRVGGNPEVLVDGETGLLVPPRDPAALARAMLQVWRDGEAARRLGRAGRRRVEAHFDVRHMVAHYETLYLSQNRSEPEA
jgi:glycosyltransferase involved in cell wall biosynthesis